MKLLLIGYLNIINIKLYFLIAILIKSLYVASFSGKSYIERPPINASLNFIDIIFYSMKVDGKLLNLKLKIKQFLKKLFY